MLSKVKQQEKGFTIIEVLIVLVIAGLIMLIVFLAVPALQRNSRNTQRRNDVSSYLGAVNEWTNNNSGQQLVDASLTGTNGVNALANLGFYTAEPTTVLTSAQTTAVAVDAFQVVRDARCSTVTVGQTVDGSGDRQIAVRFAVEGSNGGVVPQCQES